jgi:hypothetical protein
MKILHLLAAATMILLLGADYSTAREMANPRKVEAAIEAEFGPRHGRARLSPDERKELKAWLQKSIDEGPVLVVETNKQDLRGLDLLNRALGRPPRSRLLKVLGGVRKIAPQLDKCEAFLKQHQANGLFVDLGFVGETQNGVLTAATLQSGAQATNLELDTLVTVFDSTLKDVTQGSGRAKGKPILVTRAPAHQGTVTDQQAPVSVVDYTLFMADKTPCSYVDKAALTPPPKEILVTAPNNNKKRKTVLCLNRGAPDGNWPDPCDFGPFKQAGIDPTGAQVVVPLAGIIKMPNDVVLKNDGTVDATLIVTAINSNDGSSCHGQDNDLGPKVLAQTKVTDQKNLNWSILGDNALIFGRTCYQQHSGLAFNMYWSVTVKTPNGDRKIKAIVSNTGGQHSANTLMVEPVDLQWGCLPGGTLVTLANGSRKAIEDITRDDLVLGPDGKPWQVFTHIKGNDAELVEVRAVDGTVARMTMEHPVITGRDRHGRLRWTTASRLVAGIGLITAKGPSKVAAVERVAYRGSVFNMALRPLGTDKAPARGSAFYADGLLVGDQTMQGLPVADPDTVASASSRAEAK